MTAQQILDAILGQSGVVFVLCLILWSGFKGYWHWGTYTRELRERIDKLESQLDRASRVAERGTGLAQRATKLVERQSGDSDA